MTAHVKSGWTCCVSHILLEEGDPGGACEECATCGKFIRPHKMSDECGGRASSPPPPAQRGNETGKVNP